MPDTLTPPTPPAPKSGLMTSIDELSEGIFNQPNEQRMIKEKEAAERAISGKPEPPKPPAPPPPTNQDKEPELVIDGVAVEQPAEIKSEQGKKSWKMYKETVSKKITEYEKRIKDMEARVSSHPNPEALTQYESKLAELQKERDDLNERLGRASIERTPEFERHYIKRQAQVIEDVKGILPKEQSERLEAVLRMPEGSIRNGQINDLLTDLDELQKVEIGNAVKELRQINKEKNEQIENWKEGLSKREKILAEQQERGMKEYGKVFDSVLAEIQKDQPIFSMKEGDEAWNNRAKQIIEAGREVYLGKGTPQERAKSSMYGAFSAVLLETLKVQNEEMSKLTKQLEGLRGKQPAITGKDGDGGGGNPPPTPGGKSESMAERIANQAKSQGFVK